MMMVKDRPLIGINADLRLAGRNRAPFTVLQGGYYDCILAAGGIPLLIPPMVKEQDLLPIVENLDGLLLTEGAEDMDPKKMGLGFHPAIKVMSERRENCDRLLCKLAQERRIPTLAVGLGMQELMVTLGGGIYQHLPEDLPKCIPHYDPQGGLHRHVVEMVKGTLMEDIYGDGEVCVNSFHHQGIRKVAPGFREAALAPDGLVEAVESIDEDWFCVGVQWHPQNEGQITLDTQLIEAFVGSAAKASVSTTTRLKLAKAG